MLKLAVLAMAVSTASAAMPHIVMHLADDFGYASSKFSCLLVGALMGMMSLPLLM